MLRRRSVVITLTLVFALLLLLPALPASALVQKYSLARLAAESNRIVWGTVLDAAPHWNAKHDYITSTVTLAVKHWLKGSGEDRLSLDIPGGTVDGVTQVTSDTPEFAVGEEVIVFLWELDQPVTGWYQGKMTVADGHVFGSDVQPLGEFLQNLGAELALQGVSMPGIEVEARPEGSVKPSVAPNITGVSPAKGSAGTGKQVTITGTGFGTQGAGEDVSFWMSGTSYSMAEIVSWSDTVIVCEVPAFASSHATQGIRLITDDGTDYAGFTVTFGFRMWMWAGDPVQVEYYVAGNTADCTGEVLAVRKAAWTWNEVDTHSMSLKYWGATDRGAPVQDGYSVIRWASGLGAIYQMTFWGGSGIINEADIALDDSYTWSTAAICPPASYDVQNCLTHAFGEIIGLDGLSGDADSEKSMYETISSGEAKKRSLDLADQNGIKWIY